MIWFFPTSKTGWLLQETTQTQIGGSSGNRQKSQNSTIPTRSFPIITGRKFLVLGDILGSTLD
jgi:hypothetical protein